MPLKKLVAVTGESEEAIRHAVGELSRAYLEESRGFAILEVDGAFQLVSSEVCASYVRKMKKTEDETALSPSALEVLAIIAYRAPISRSEIEMIRGVNCSSLLRSLSIRGLVDRSEHPENAKVFVYRPSAQLFSLLGLRSVAELPGYSEYSHHAKLHPSV